MGDVTVTTSTSYIHVYGGEHPQKTTIWNGLQIGKNSAFHILYLNLDILFWILNDPLWEEHYSPALMMPIKRFNWETACAVLRANMLCTQQERERGRAGLLETSQRDSESTSVLLKEEQQKKPGAGSTHTRPHICLILFLFIYFTTLVYELQSEFSLMLENWNYSQTSPR